MSSIEEHVENSLRRISENNPEVLGQKGAEKLKQLLTELHEWLDFYEGKKGGNYDYTGINYIKHREQRHHAEGIQEAVSVFSEKYGSDLAQIIDREATAHVLEDMGRILLKEDYRAIGFWRNERGF